MNSYVKDNEPSTTADGEALLWHKLTGYDSTAHVDHDVFRTACGREITGFPTILYGEMRLKDWDAMFGEDVELCFCAVHPDDLGRVNITPKENA